MSEFKADVDYPNLRQEHLCCLCFGHKGKGLVVCWRCYNEFDMRNGNREVNDALAEVEARLKALLEGKALAEKPHVFERRNPAK
jgi:hypothetical protein